jgi:hypothetical protein
LSANENKLAAARADASDANHPHLHINFLSRFYANVIAEVELGEQRERRSLRSTRAFSPLWRQQLF